MYIKLAKADPLNEQLEDVEVHIYITEKLPQFKTLEEAKFFYQRQVSLLVDVLFNLLPQGTLDRLLIALMEHKVSLYRGKTK